MRFHHPTSSVRRRSVVRYALALVLIVAAPGSLIAQEAQPASPLEVVEFRKAPLDHAMRILSQQAGLKIVPSAKAAPVEINLYLEDVTPAAAIEAMCKAHSLWYRLDETTGIYRIHTVEEYTRDVTAFREEHSEVFTLLYPNAVDVAHAIQDLYGSRVQLGLGTDEEQEFEELEERFDRFDLLDKRSEGLGTFGGSLTGIGLSRSDSFSQGSRFGGGRRVRNVGLSGRRELQRLEDEIRRPRIEDLAAEEIQALEAAAASRQAGDQAAIEQILSQRRATIYITLLRKQNRLVVRTSDEQTIKELRALVRRLDVPTPMVLLEVKILSILLGDGFESAFDFSFQAGEASGRFSTGQIGTPTLGNILTGSTGIINPQAAIIQYVGEQFQARLQLLESENRVTRLATPMVLTANNEVSRIFAGDTLPIVVGFTEPETILADGGTITTPGSPITELRDVGTSLLVTPNINADRTVTLRILQENSEVQKDGAVIPVPTGDGMIVEQPIDTIRRQALTGTIVGKDGVAAAVSGLIEETISDREERFPILGEIPVLGLLFQRQVTDRERRELVILIRPYVITTPAEAEGISDKLLRELSIHPTAVEKRGTLNTYSPDDVIRADHPKSNLHKLFKFHSAPDKSKQDD